MAGFNLPITQYTPAQLADMARLAFKPPALMGGGGGGGGSLGQLPQSQGFNLGQSIAGAGQGLGAFAGSFNKAPSIEDINQWGVNDPKLAQAMRDSPDINFRTRQSNTDIADFVNTSGGGLSRFFGSLFGGARADGGPVTPGKYYTVGEQGPETFVPNVPGRIVPRDFFGGRVRR